ncbi:MAG: hypothetical protein A2Y93_13120 [Chloroflexi bacterium RBG_13_68_17]|jgi:two-component system sensor histidine kinase UhpB|nr:MAG: hypothetical protein A2Y93_13120 [Chloroflexi bacterium RBG_13_68_17]
MVQSVGTLGRLRQRLQRLSIFNRVLLGNSIVIVVGAVGGTLLTRQLAVQADLWLILVFSSLGILLSLLVNYRVLRSALQPLRALVGRVDQVQAGKDPGQTLLLGEADPDTQRLAAAIDSMRSRLQEHAGQLRALTMQAITAQEDERKRIARNLHDDTGQALSTLIITLERLETSLPPAASELRPRLQAARELATRTLEDLRKLVYGLRPSMLDDLGLVPAIRWFARSSLEETGAQLTFESFEDTTRLPPQVETAVFRIAQEAIHNIVRHAQAHRVAIRLDLAGEAVILRVEDDGRGFDVSRTTVEAVRQRRLGLLGIQERVELFGGDLMVDSAPGGGTRLQARVPLAGMEDQPHG